MNHQTSKPDLAERYAAVDRRIAREARDGLASARAKGLPMMARYFQEAVVRNYLRQRVARRISQ